MAATAASLLAGCGTLLPASARYAGASPPCPGGAGLSATLARVGTTFAFSPADGAIVVRGSVRADGELAGSLALGSPGRAASPGGAGSRADHASPLTLVVSGRLTEDAARVEYVAGACYATVTLARIHPGLL